MKYHVYYDRDTRPWDDSYQNHGRDVLLGVTHVFVRTVEVAAPGNEGRDIVFNQMQGEVWSPNGEARLLIEYLGLEHTSMSVGDVLVDEMGNILLCHNTGWRQIEEADPRVCVFMERDDPNFMFGHWRSRQPLALEQWRDIGEIAAWLEMQVVGEEFWEKGFLPRQLQEAEGVSGFVKAIYGMFLQPSSAPVYLLV